MDWPGIAVAGLVGTAAITALMYAAPLTGMPKMDIAQTLGSMVLPQGVAAFGMGMAMHFVIGVVFAAIYAQAWDSLDVAVGWPTGLAFGAVHFVVAAVGMNLMATVHKEVKAGRLPGPTAGGARGMMGLLMAHLLYGLVVALVYAAYV